MIKKNQAEEKQQVPKDPYAEPASEYNDLYKQYINLERDFRDAEKNAEEYRRKASQKEYEELYNLAPIVKNLRRDADQVNAFFINYPESIDE